MHKRALLVLALAFTVSCGEPPDPDKDAGAGTVSFRRQIRPIFVARCMPCHSSPIAVVDVTNIEQLKTLDNTWTEARNSKLVVPGKPDESFLLTKISATDLTEKEGAPMPPETVDLTEDEFNTIRQWVADGASADDPNFGTDDMVDRTRVKYIFGIEAPNSASRQGKCVICHGPNSLFEPNIEFPFDAVKGLINIEAEVNGTRVIPGDPDNSVLIKKLTRPLPGGVGAAMPPKFLKLNAQQVGLVRTWIEEGALDN